MVLCTWKLHFCLILGCLAVLHSASAQSNSAVDTPSVSWLSATWNAATGWVDPIFGMLTGRIYGGSAATNEQRPYVAYVAYHPIAPLRTKFKIAVCSGAILTTKKILTAASCFSVLSGDNSVYVGASRTNNKFKKGVGTQYEIESKATYSQGGTSYNFNTNPFLHDLAIVTLKTAMTFGSTVSAIALPETAAAATVTNGGASITISGYGLDSDITALANSTSNSNSTAKEAIKGLKNQSLKTATQTGLSDAECGNQLSAYLSSRSDFTQITLPNGNVITKAQLAAEAATQICPELIVVKGTDSGPCLFGDNGGPMVKDNKIYGVLSILLACTNTTLASFGNELSGDHLTWVKANGN